MDAMFLSHGRFFLQLQTNPTPSTPPSTSKKNPNNTSPSLKGHSSGQESKGDRILCLVDAVNN